MPTSKQLAEHVHQVYFGGNWAEVNIKDTVESISYELATKKMANFNTILALTYHIHYFTSVQLKVLQRGVLEGKDSESYNHPNIASQLEWEAFLKTIWEDAERFTTLLAQLPNNKLEAPFIDEKYSTYARNILGLLEHTHYHLGQIVILKKLASID